jgi:hypothetical protein
MLCRADAEMPKLRQKYLWHGICEHLSCHPTDAICKTINKKLLQMYLLVPFGHIENNPMLLTVAGGLI